MKHINYRLKNLKKKTSPLYDNAGILLKCNCDQFCIGKPNRNVETNFNIVRTLYIYIIIIYYIVNDKYS